MVAGKNIDKKQIWQWLDDIPDPEIPVISIVDLGIVREVCIDDDQVTVTITPTYSGCPAMSVIPIDIQTELVKRGVDNLTIETQIAPAWTTNWLSKKAHTKLQEYGIAPPHASGVPEYCPRCHSSKLEKVSQFGSTPCKAQWRCNECLEPFDYFKCM